MGSIIAGPAQFQLATLAGQWHGSGDVHASAWGPGSAAKGHWHNRMDRLNLNLIVDYHEARSDGSQFEGHGVMTIDPESGEVLWFWFDSYGYPPLSPYRGRWNGNELVLTKRTPRGVGRTIFSLEGDTLTQAMSSQATDAASATAVSTMVFNRQEQTSNL